MTYDTEFGMLPLVVAVAKVVEFKVYFGVLSNEWVGAIGNEWVGAIGNE